MAICSPHREGPRQGNWSIAPGPSEGVVAVITSIPGKALYPRMTKQGDAETTRREANSLQLESITFGGYKAFAGGEGENAELQQLSLAPLTLIFGKNNSGKSAVARFPRLLLGGLACTDERILP